jgi:hypothetical protein
MKGRHPEIILTRSARDAVEEGTEVDHFVTGFDIVEIEDFGACQGLVHGLVWVAVLTFMRPGPEIACPDWSHRDLPQEPASACRRGSG